MTLPTKAAEIAARLTPEQEVFVRAWFLDDVQSEYPHGNALAETALVDWARSFGLFDPCSYRASPLGQAVAEHLGRE